MYFFASNETFSYRNWKDSEVKIYQFFILLCLWTYKHVFIFSSTFYEVHCILCIFFFVFIYIYIYIWICVCVRVCVCIYSYIYVCICVYVYVYMCAYIYIYVCVCVCVLIYIYIYIYIWLNNKDTFCLYNFIKILSSFLISVLVGIGGWIYQNYP